LLRHYFVNIYFVISYHFFLSFFFFHSSRPLLALHSFPTRRSSDLLVASFAMRAHVCYIYVRGEFIREREALQRAVDEAYAAKLIDRKSTRLNSSHRTISYAVFCLKKKKRINNNNTT